MFKNLLELDIQPDITKIDKVKEIKLNESLKKELTSLFQEEESGFVNVSDYTTTIKPDKNYIFFPNQYFYLAIICKDYATALYTYCDFFDKKIRNNNSIKLIVLKRDFKNEKYRSLFSNDVDFDNFSKFITGGIYRPGKEFINGDSFRGTKDIFGSCILKKMPLPDASSSYFGNIVYYLAKNPNVYNNLCDFFYTELQKSSDDINNIYSTDNSPSPITINQCEQIIFYGVPGSGKSHMINKTLDDKIKDKKRREQQVVRVVFHPEYTNADFVGQILPVLNDSGVEYRFKAGPFSRILKRALKNPDKPYYLIIEEINRGNAAAIFGDLFQLLDRNVDGWSSYPIENLDVNSFLRSESDSYNDKNTASFVKVGNIDFDENTGIRLPPNLSILATMNTSDQNVFTLDNAFQRRWEMELVENKFDDDDKDSQNQKNAVIEGSSVSWEQFQTKINAKISAVSLENNLSSMVDKRLGCWFVKAAEKGNGGFEIKEEDFKNKILKYLWDDAFKFNREVFETAENFEELIKKVNMENPNFGIFKDLDFNENKNSGSNSDANGNEQN